MSQFFENSKEGTYLLIPTKNIASDTNVAKI